MNPIGMRSLCVIALCFSACGGPGSKPATRPARAIPDVAVWVDPRIGTGGSGNVFMGAARPHGRVKLGPDTRPNPAVESYRWEDGTIYGFTHTHLQGHGGSANGYSQILLMPATGALQIEPAKWAAPFAHADEVASADGYRVTFKDGETTAELAATAHVGLHRYTFAGTQVGRVMLDLDWNRGEARGGHVEVTEDGAKGWADYSVHPMLTALLDGYGKGPTGLVRVFFAVHNSRPHAIAGTFQGGKASPGSTQAEGPATGAYFEFDTSKDAIVETRVALSWISVQQAEANYEAEGQGVSLEQARADTRSAWNRLLSRVEVEGGTDADRTRMYTALYHALLAPTDDTEGDSFWTGAGASGAVIDANGRRFYSDDWCTWDTAKTTHPLLTLVEPEVVSDMVQSFVTGYTLGGWIPKCTWTATGDSRVMTANHSFCIIADAYVKGLRGFDADTAWQGVYKGSMQDSDYPGAEGFCGYLNQGTPPHYVSKGWVPSECDPGQAASMTLEYAYNDFCSAQFASALGRTDDAAFFAKRAKNYANVWNPAHGFMQLKDASGAWKEPFDPMALAGFTEANAWIYTWQVQHDPCGLAALLGGHKAMEDKLDAFFDGGHFDLSNEPDFHAPWLYVDAGAPHATQAKVRALLAQHFTTAPDGLPGNDDTGATSAWFAFAAMGLYPMAPGDPTYRITAPLWSRVTLHLEPDFADGRDFVVESSGSGVYVKSAMWNAAVHNTPWIGHAEIQKGGTLALALGDAPATWGIEASCP